MENFIQHAAGHGVTRMFGHMTVPPGKRSNKLFELLGWKMIDQKEQTKYRDYVEEGPVYTITLYREITPTTRWQRESSVRESSFQKPSISADD